MIPLRTLVVAVDLSPGSAAAVREAADLAARSGAALHLVHADVHYHARGDEALPDGAPSSVRRLEVDRFAAEALRLRGDLDAYDRLGATVAVARAGTAPDAILGYAAGVGADLLVLGTHGRSGLPRLLLGSVAEACIAAAPCPVLTVPTRAAGRRPGATAPVLVGVDFSRRSASVVAAARALAARYRADVELVHVVRDAGPYPGLVPDVLSLSDLDPVRDAAVRARLAHLAAPGADDVPPGVHVAIGSPARALAALAAERHAGAVVLGTHGRTGAARAFLGSVAEATLRRVSCPVLTLSSAVPLGPVRRPVASALSS